MMQEQKQEQKQELSLAAQRAAIIDELKPLLAEAESLRKTLDSLNHKILDLHHLKWNIEELQLKERLGSFKKKSPRPRNPRKPRLGEPSPRVKALLEVAK